ncbi:hypothetical protein [Streptomyces olivaceus]|uniref:hypothetical protein n=1 Tax=Streptomyces olivaceus TaxID=47716 RepID=UPI0040562BDC
MAASSPIPERGEVPAAVAGRVLLQVGSRREARIRPWIDAAASGLVLTGKGALAKAVRLREAGFAAPLLVDEARYQAEYATVQAPFPGLEDGPASLFGNQLEELMTAQLAFADAALTPTGYVAAGAAAALEAAAAQVRRLGDPRVVFCAPVDAGWLYPGALEQLAEVLRSVPGPVAVLVGGRPEPQAAAAGLARLLQLVPGAGALRGGMGAFGVLGLGAGFSAFGVDSSMRQVLPPDAQSRSGGGPGSPSVLFAELMNFYLGLTLAGRFNGQAPPCMCDCCQGEPLDRFLDMSQQVPAAGHNACVLTGWARQSHALDALDRGAWWRSMCRSALERYPLWSQRIRHEQGFAVGADLPVWAHLPVPEGVPGRVMGAGGGAAR